MRSPTRTIGGSRLHRTSARLHSAFPTTGSTRLASLVTISEWQSACPVWCKSWRVRVNHKRVRHWRLDDCAPAVGQPRAFALMADHSFMHLTECPGGVANAVDSIKTISAFVTVGMAGDGVIELIDESIANLGVEVVNRDHDI